MLLVTKILRINNKTVTTATSKTYQQLAPRRAVFPVSVDIKIKQKELTH